jgi:hypothetical protein
MSCVKSQYISNIGVCFMFLGYIDDSGRFDKKAQTFQVIAAVLVHDKLFAQIEAQVGLWIEDVILGERLETFEEIHAWQLYRGCGAFEGIEQDVRFSAIEKLLGIIRDHKLPVFYGAVNVPQFEKLAYGSASPTDVAFRLCLPEISAALYKCQDDGPEYALLIADETDKDKKTAIRKSFRQLRKHVRPPTWGPSGYLHDDMYFGNSKDSIGIQLADLCAFFIGKHLEKDQSTEGFYNIFSKQVASGKMEPDV